MNVLSDSGVFITRVPDHTYHKTQILKSIQAMGVFGMTHHNSNVFNTDWHLPESWFSPREYWDICTPSVSTHITALIEHMYPNFGAEWTIEKFWFQQYLPDIGTHEWHVHGGSMFSSVYYVELPDSGAATSILVGGREINIPVSEGDIVSFPSAYAHRSKKYRCPNGSKKTVVAFNTNIQINELSDGS